MHPRFFLSLLLVVFGVLPVSGSFNPTPLPRITIDGDRFYSNDKPIVLNGANTPWQEFGKRDFGMEGFNPEWWDSHFARFNENGLNASRVWLCVYGDQNIVLIDETGHVSGASQAHWEDLDSLFEIAQRHGVYIMATLISFDHFKVKDHPISAPWWANWINDDDNIDSYIDNYVIPFVQRYKTNPALWSIDLMNEPAWATTHESGPIPYDRLKMYFAKAAKAIHEVSSIPVTVGTVCIKYNSDADFGGRIRNMVSDAQLQSFVDDPNAFLDFWSPHQYQWTVSHHGNGMIVSPGDFGLEDSRPSVFGECPGKSVITDGIRSTLIKDLKSAYAKGWSGAFPWTSNSVDPFGGWKEASNAGSALMVQDSTLLFPHADIQSPVTVICVGDSITAGSAGTYGFPPELRSKLPIHHFVMNFGVSGTTALAPGRGDLPYEEQIEHQSALESQPDIVVIMLGTNDTKDVNWVHEQSFVADYRTLINRFKNLTPAPKVYLATPPPAFESLWTINPSRVETVIGPRVRELANELNIQGIDTYTPLIGKPGLFGDGIHPNASGNDRLAEIIRDAISGPDDNTAPSAPSAVTAFTASETSVHVSWDAATGNPSGYEVYRDGVCVGVVPSSTRSFDERELTPGIYRYKVRSFDGALNLSTMSAESTVDTRIPTPDNVPPSVPTGLSCVVSGTSVTLTWEPSTDNLGVAGYDIRRDSTIQASEANTAWIDTGLTRSTTYSYSVRAYDAAGNKSNYCTAKQVTIPAANLPSGWNIRDIGSIGIAGDAFSESGVFTVKASGSDIYNKADSFSYAYTTLSGDGSITARITSQENTNEWAKCGVMVRETLEPGSKHASMVATPYNKVSFQCRTTSDSSARAGVSTSFTSYPVWVRLIRSGDSVSGYYSPDGSNWTLWHTQSLTMNANVWIGLAHCSHDNTRLNT
ncbi:MAG: DUF1349 domain-containing protein, partial [Opitutales bacterium]|nr:DUF1349 domain-containing protein [Opitutales bacterium]